MTAVAQAKAVMEGLAGKTLAVAKMTAIVNNYIASHPRNTLPESPTNEQKAQFFIDSLKGRVRNLVRNGALVKHEKANSAARDTAQDNASADL